MRNLTLILFLTISCCYGQEDQSYSIDDNFTDCLDSIIPFDIKKADSCIEKASKEWDKELNKNYNKLLSLLTTEKESLVDSQNKWLKYRESVVKFSDNLLDDNNRLIERKRLFFELTKQRVDELTWYIELVSD